MKYFKDDNDEIFGFEPDGSQNHLIKDNMVEITIDDVNAINHSKKTLDQLIGDINQAVESMLSQLITDNGYSSRINYSKYVGYDNIFRNNAEALGAYEAEVWVYCEAQIVLLKSGDRTIPTTVEFLTELPVFNG